MFEQKIDGWRALRFPGIDGKVRLWTRNGYPIEGTGHILHRLALMERVAGEPMVFDGEFQVGGTLEATKHWCERGWRLGEEAGTFYAFDCLTLAEWRAGGTDRPLYERKAQLQALARAVDEDPALSWEWRPGSHGRDESGAVQVLADGWATDAADVIDAVQRVWAIGGEGCMLKDASAPYRRTRSIAWQKVKAENWAKWKVAA
jgi:ATP-dependent DNA ligase